VADRRAAGSTGRIRGKPPAGPARSGWPAAGTRRCAGGGRLPGRLEVPVGASRG